MVQSLRFAWGEWEDEWRGGKFTCVFRQAAPKDGWIEAEGLYEAQDGDTIDDLWAVDEEIAARTAVVAKDGLLRVPIDFVELLALLPSVVSELAAHVRECDTEGSIIIPAIHPHPNPYRPMVAQ